MIWVVMFCRGCAYDLRGQQTPRCPECGTEFDFDDPATFFTQTPTRPRRLLRWYRRRRRLWTCLLTVGMFASLFVGMRDLPGPWAGYSFYKMNCLRGIVLGWRFEQEEDPSVRVDIRALAEEWCGSRLSPRPKPNALWARAIVRHVLGAGPVLLLIAIAYVALLSLLYPSRFRGVWFVAFAFLQLLLIPCAFSNQIPDALWPDSYAFLDDFVIVGDVLDEGPIPLDERIVAYDKYSFKGDRPRLVAFGDASCSRLDPEEAERLFREQGIPLPSAE